MKGGTQKNSTFLIYFHLSNLLPPFKFTSTFQISPTFQIYFHLSNLLPPFKFTSTFQIYFHLSNMLPPFKYLPPFKFTLYPDENFYSYHLEREIYYTKEQVKGSDGNVFFFLLMFLDSAHECRSVRSR